MSIKFKYNDGGRAEAGYKGDAGDCGCRAASIALGVPYKTMYDLMNDYAKKERITKRNRTRSSARDGYARKTFHKLMYHFGWVWVPCMSIGSGCKTHLNDGEIPSDQPIICNLSKHYAAVVDGVLNDTYDSSRDGTRCVYGYWKKCDNFGEYAVYAGAERFKEFTGSEEQCKRYIKEQWDMSTRVIEKNPTFDVNKHDNSKVAGE